MIPDIPGYEDLCIGGVIQSGGYGIGTPYHYGSVTNHVRSFGMLIVDKDRKVYSLKFLCVDQYGDILALYRGLCAFETAVYSQSQRVS